MMERARVTERRSRWPSAELWNGTPSQYPVRVSPSSPSSPARVAAVTRSDGRPHSVRECVGEAGTGRPAQWNGCPLRGGHYESLNDRISLNATEGGGERRARLGPKAAERPCESRRPKTLTAESKADSCIYSQYRIGQPRARGVRQPTTSPAAALGRTRADWVREALTGPPIARDSESLPGGYGAVACRALVLR
jgi:hypothetical protein